LNARSRLPPPGPLPDSHALRARALAASWQRDRAVHRRRLAWRWVQWAFMRYGVPALVGAAAVVLLVSQVTELRESPSRSATPSQAPDVAAPAQTPTTTATAAAATPSAPEPPGAEPLTTLRLDTRLGEARTAAAPITPPPGPTDPDFRLQSDDYLHSKEP
jgi:hypothetical protein